LETKAINFTGGAGDINQKELDSASYLPQLEMHVQYGGIMRIIKTSNKFESLVSNSSLKST
jgi:hypothetical protein